MLRVGSSGAVGRDRLEELEELDHALVEAEDADLDLQSLVTAEQPGHPGIVHLERQRQVVALEGVDVEARCPVDVADPQGDVLTDVDCPSR